MAVTATRDAVDKKRAKHLEYHIDESQVLNPAKGKHYKPVNVKRIDHWRQRGYEITPWNSPTKLLGGHKGKDGGQECGDLILMETSRDIRNARIQRSRDKQRRMESSYREGAREQINRIAKDEAHVRTRRDLVIDESHEGGDDDD